MSEKTIYQNITITQGFIASDLKLEPTANGQRCYFDIKVEKNKKGKVIAEFIPFTLWNAVAEQFVAKFHKGDNILIQGELSRNRSADGRKYLIIDCGVIKLIFPATELKAS